MGIRVNVSDQEARSQDREPLPKGKFHFKFTDMEIRTVNDTTADGSQNKNAGKPYINFELTVQDGKYAGRKDWTNMMCFEGALYTAAQILKALDYDFPVDRNGKAIGGSIDIPDDPDFYIGKDVWGRRDVSRRDKKPVVDESGEPRIQLQGFSKYDATKGGASEAVETTSRQTASAAVLP
jgi:hypothetical protein